MNNITPLHSFTGWTPDLPKKQRGKSTKNYATTATLRRLVEAARSSGINPSSITFMPDGSVQLSELPAVVGRVADEFTQWEDRL